MVDFARIQNRIYYGYGKAAQRLGTTHAVYRSSDGINPIQPANFLANQLISIDDDYTYKKSRKYGDMTWQFLPQDGLVLQNYDYLVGGSVTYFVADVAPDDRLSPPMCVECNATITISRPEENLVPGKNSYQQFKEPYTEIAINCPCAVLQYTRMEANTMKLPTSVKLPMYTILFPDFDDIVLKTGDLIQDNKERRLTIITAEQTKKVLGIRILAQELGT